MRPRPALSLLALALPLPMLLAAAPRSTTAPPEAVVERVPVLREEVTPAAPPRAKTPRPAPRRTASRSRRAAPRPHVAAPRPAATRSRTVTPTSRSYPWATATGGHDAWGFTVRQCVSYVAWRLARVGRPVSTRQGWDSASGWDDTARRKGITVTSRPAVGSVAQWNAGERSRVYTGSGTGTFTAGSYGHVAWVTKVYGDGSVQVSQYNGDGSRGFSSMRVFAPRFLRM